VVLLSPSQIDGIFVRDSFELGDLDHQVIELLVIAEKISLFDKYLLELPLAPVEDPKGKLAASHLVNFMLTLHSKRYY
jgi:hypothetical protein